MRSATATLLGAAAAGGLVAFAVAISPVRARTPDGQDFTLIEKGRYLATAADCVACHTVRNGGKPFAGGRPIETPFGNIVSPNITPDADTGIGAWTEEQFDNAVRRGTRPDGSRLYPAMPYTSYTRMTRDDVKAIHAYLSTVAPVRNAVEPNTLPFPFDIRAAMHAWDAAFFNEGEFQGDLSKSPEWNRGAYLVQGPGHCTACHTPKNLAGADKANALFKGGPVQGWFAPELTNDETAGLGRWSVEELTAYLKTGHNSTATATGPMAEEIENSTSKLNDSDLKAMAVYLKSLPGAAAETTALAATDPVMRAGQAIYRDQCSACHGLDGRGSPHLFPSLAEAPSVRAHDAASLIRVVLRGARSVATPKEPTAPGMPSFAWQLNDAQVAAVLTYVRNAWKPAAPAVGEDDVRKARAALSARSD